MPTRVKKATDAPTHPRTSLNTAKKQRAFHSAKDYETSASQLGDVLAPEAEAQVKARTIAAEALLRREPNATAADLTEVLMMLGIHPDQPDWDEVPSIQPSRPKGM